MGIDILNLLILLSVAWVAGSIATKIGYPSILGELLAGIIFGPPLLGFIESTEAALVLAELGIILMMLYVGMEIDMRDLRKASWAGLLAAIGGFITPAVFGYLTVIWFGGSEMAAMFIAVAVGVTSLTTKSRILIDLKILDTRIASVLMAGALISDTVALVLFAAILGIAEEGNFQFMEILWVTGKAVVFFIVTGAIGIYVFPYVGRKLETLNFENRTLYFTLLLLITFGFAEMAELAGLHHILGAFIAGLFIRDNVFHRKLSKELNAVFYDISIGFLAPVFFVTAGFQVTFDVFSTELPLLLTVVGVAIVGKILGTVLFYVFSGNGWREGLAIGSGMNGRGAVEIIIAGIGLNMGIISQEIFSILVFMAIFTTATVPFLLTLTVNWLRRRGELVRSDNLKKGYLFVGAGPTARLIAKRIAKPDQPLVLIDNNKELVKEAKEVGFEAYSGNALKDELLEEVNAENFRTFIGITPNSEINLLAAQLAKEAYFIPEILVLITHSEEGADIESLKIIDAYSIFAQKANLIKWDSIIRSEQYEEKIVEVKDMLRAREIAKYLAENDEDSLPIVYERKDGQKKPFHYGAELEAGDKIIYLVNK